MSHFAALLQRCRSPVLHCVLLVFACSAPVTAGQSPAPAINVNGSGHVNLSPDMAVLELTITRNAKTAAEALKQNSRAMNQVVETLQASGIEARDLQTSGFAIQPDYVYSDSSSKRSASKSTIVGYTVRNSLTVRVRDIDATGALLDTVVTLGVNDGGNITLTNADPSAAIEQARVLAMKDALSKARTLAEAAGVGLGPIQSIRENSYQPGPQPVRAAYRGMALAAEPAPTPIVAGENRYEVQVSLSIAIDQ